MPAVVNGDIRNTPVTIYQAAEIVHCGFMKIMRMGVVIDVVLI